MHKSNSWLLVPHKSCLNHLVLDKQESLLKCVKKQTISTKFSTKQQANKPRNTKKQENTVLGGFFTLKEYKFPKINRRKEC